MQTLAFSETGSRPVMPKPGEPFGHYRIGKLLGEGGMGAVFQAEDLENGRQVALKLLGQRLDSPETRNRFFREGRLAASVNHPNSVYVFGTEDIAGVPVIAMELMAGGTLHDRVVREGPMPVGEAVDSMLQVIAGLEAAQQVGVLHRDIKPSNCFVEANGRVKIGDFGLSISTVMRMEPSLTATGTFLGTPAFASPEQLRGDELTVRSDIYSVGVTLYFLITGRHPFDAPDMVRLLATVLERKAESPAKWRPELPTGICRLVLRCLEKDPERRFGNYNELREALSPYASTAPTPATLGLRFGAYVLDATLLTLLGGLASVLVNLLWSVMQTGHANLAEAIMTQFSPHAPSSLVMHNLSGMALALSYYSWLEGSSGASFGKRLCGLRVTRLDHTVPGWRRAFVRALIISGTPTVLWLLGWNAAHNWGSDSSVEQLVTGIGLIILPARLALFLTARQRNGYAGIHDLLTATRVVLKSAYQPRPGLPPAPETPPELQAMPLLGPYHVLECIGRENGAELFAGFDARLLRRVWLEKQPLGSPPLSATLRQLSRPGRLRWLTARRSETECWDAYEAISGQPLSKLIEHPQEWGHVRYWLLDLAEELLAATQDGTLPTTLSLQRVWITADGHAKLLDFPVPETDKLGSGQLQCSESPTSTPLQFLKVVAASALQGRLASPSSAEFINSTPLALHASRFLNTLKPGAELSQCAAELRNLLHLPSRISRTRRAVLLLGALAFPITVAALAWGLTSFKRNVLLAAPELATLNECLIHYDQLQRKAHSEKFDNRETIDAFETYIAGRFAAQVSNNARWNNPITRVVVTSPFREEAEQILKRRPSPTAEELATASARLEQFFKKSPDLAARDALQRPNIFVGALLAGYGFTVALVILPCLAASLLFRGGALARLLGITFVNRNGLLASRWRATVRNFLAWMPFLLIVVSAKMHEALPFVIGLITLVLTGISLLLPRRGLQDLLVGTWPVPR